jgi:hypothetical protein
MCRLLMWLYHAGFIDDYGLPAMCRIGGGCNILTVNSIEKT